MTQRVPEPKAADAYFDAARQARYRALHARQNGNTGAVQRVLLSMARWCEEQGRKQDRATRPAPLPEA